MKKILLILIVFFTHNTGSVEMEHSFVYQETSSSVYYNGQKYDANVDSSAKQPDNSDQQTTSSINKEDIPIIIFAMLAISAFLYNARLESSTLKEGEPPHQ